MFIRINPYLCHLLTRYQSTIFPNHKSCVRKKGVPKDSLYVYTVTTEAFLTGDDFIDDTKPATADTMKKSYHIGDLTAIYR